MKNDPKKQNSKASKPTPTPCELAKAKQRNTEITLRLEELYGIPSQHSRFDPLEEPRGIHALRQAHPLFPQHLHDRGLVFFLVGV